MYLRQWGGTHPGCLIVLVDQSGSMADSFGGTQIGAGRSKSDMVATVLNRILEEIIQASTIGANIRPRADVAVLGYEGASVRSALPPPLDEKDFVTLPELRQHPRSVEVRRQKTMDDTGELYEEEVYFNVWIDPVAGGGTPMGAALEAARDLAHRWAKDHPDNYPPVIINITDAAATDLKSDQLLALADEIKAVSTSDGNALFFNCHITNSTEAQMEFPAHEGELPREPYAKLMFEMSSVLPEPTRAAFNVVVGRELLPGTRAYIFNGDANSVRKMLTFGSTVGTGGPPDPNR